MHDDHRSNLPVTQSLPRQIYRIIVGLAAWLVVSVWGFAGTGGTGLTLTVVSLFIAAVVGLPWTLGLIARRHCPVVDDGEADTLSSWLARDFDGLTGRLPGTVAAAQVLLPIAAAAFGMTLLALVHHFDIGT